MAKHGSPTVVIEYDDGPGGTLRDVTAHVLSIGGIEIEQITEQTNPFGSDHEHHTPVGVQRVADIDIEGLEDDTPTTGTVAVLGTPDDSPADATRTLRITPAAGRVFTIETRLAKAATNLANQALNRYRATIRQAGKGVWS